MNKNPKSRSQDKLRTSKSRGEEKYSYQFSKDQVIAVKSGRRGKEEVKLYVVSDDLKTNDDKGRVKVVELKKIQDQKGNQIFEPSQEQLVPVKQSQKTIVEHTRTEPKKKSSRGQFIFTSTQIQQITKELQDEKSEPVQKPVPQRAKVQKTQLQVELDEHEEDASESEQEIVKRDTKQAQPQKSIGRRKAVEQEEKEQQTKLKQQKSAVRSINKKKREQEEEQEEEKPKEKKSIKKDKGKKAVQEKDVEEEEGSADKIKKRKAGNSISVEKTKETSASKRGRKIQVTDYKESSDEVISSSEEEQDQLQEEEEEEEVPKKRKESKTKKAKVVKYVKGKQNPKIERVIDRIELLDGESDTMNLNQSVRQNNKELIRAARTGNMKLLENILKTEYKISSLFERWAPERDFNAIEVIFQKADSKMLTKLIQVYKEKHKLKLTSSSECSLKEIDTGYNDKFAYGVRTRKVALSRGGREGNNALVQDITNEGEWSEYMMDRLLETETDPHLFTILRATLDHHTVMRLDQRVAVAVRAGNYQIAGALIKENFKKGNMCGFNIVHEQVLTSKDASIIGQIKRPSALKKTIGPMIITPVHCAAINPNPEFLNLLLDISNEFSIMDEIMRKPVHYAAVCSGTGPLELLLKRGVDAREGDRDKNTPLMLACKTGRYNNVRVLVTQANLQPADMNGKNKEGQAAIHFAAQGGHLECIKELIKSNANINLPGKNRMTALMIASAYGHYHLVEFLLEQGAKILLKDKFKRSSLIMAVRNGNTDVASLLLMKGAEFNGTDSSKNSCIHYAAAYGFPDCINLLIQAGADQNVKNSWKLTPLSVALQKNLFGIVKSLLNYESTDVNCKDDEGRTLVSSSLTKFNADTFEYIKFLIIDKKADVTIADLKGKTPLHYAAQINPQDVSQFYPNWQITSKTEKDEIIESYTQLIQNLIALLLDHGGDINIQDLQGQTPLLQALQVKNFVIAQRMISLREPDVTQIDKKDQNILHHLSQGGLFLDPIGDQFFRSILDKLPDKASYLRALNEDGASPYLLVIHWFTQEAKNQYNQKLNQFLNETYDEKLEEVLKNEKKTTKGKRKSQAPQKTPKAPRKVIQQEEDDSKSEEEQQDIQEEKDQNDIIEEEEEEEEEVQRPQKIFPKKSAHPSFAFSSGASMFAQAQQVQTLQGGYAKTFYIGNQPKVVQITSEEYTAIRLKSLQAYRDQEDRFLSLIQFLIRNGADPLETFGKVKAFRRTITNLQMEVEQEGEEHSGLRGGARTQQTARRSIGGKHPAQQFVSLNQQTDPNNGKSRYLEWGKQNALHMIFKSYQSVSFLQKFLDITKPNLDEQDHLGRTPLICFASSCNQDACFSIDDPSLQNQNQFVDYLVNTLKVNIHLADKNHNTAASILATRGQFVFLEILCKQGASPNNLNKDNIVPLIHWVQNNNIVNVRKLIELGADTNFRDQEKRTSLHHAVNKSSGTADASFELEMLLIRHGAKADILDKNHRTPLFYAFVKIGDPFQTTEIDPFETVSSLCALPDCSVNVMDKWKKTPLHYAAQRGSVISGRYIIKLKAEVDSFDSDGNTPLAIAFISGHANFATMLIDNKANVSETAHKIDVQKLMEKIRKEQQEAIQKKQQHQINLAQEDEDEEEEEEQQQENSEENEDEESEQVQSQQNHNFGFQNNNNQFGFYGGSVFGQPQRQSNNIPPGNYSFFMLAIKHGWQGVAYLLISDGFDIQRAIEDAIKADQFKLVKTLLMKVKNNELLRKQNKEGHNLFHIFAIKGKNANQIDANAIIEELLYRGVDASVLDNQKRSALYHASEYNFQTFIKILLEKGCDPNQYDDSYNTPFTIGIQKYFDSFQSQQYLDLWLNAGTNLNLNFKVNGKLTTLMIYLIEEKNLLQEATYQSLINKGVDLNVKDDDGQGVIVHSIKINSIKLVKFFLDQPSLNLEVHKIDSKGRTPIHIVVQPLEFGSYENSELLRVLAKHFDIEQADFNGRSPMEYAANQDSGILKAELIKLGATVPEFSTTIRRAPTSVVSSVSWAEEEVDYEADAQLYLDKRQEEEQAKLRKEQKKPEIKVDSQALSQGGQLSVVIDEESGPYSLIMIKVDVKNGWYSENLFYRMQLLHERNRNVFILFTRWGRIGTLGQFQLTPFEDLESGVKEFTKIFNQKAGNDWKQVQSKEVEFQKKRGKYFLIQMSEKVNYKQFLEPFNYTAKSPYPPCELNDSIKGILTQFTQVKLYSKQIEQLHVDTDLLPLERLKKASLMRAREYLNEIGDLIHELQDLQKPGRSTFEQEELDELQRIKDEICEKSSRYYELVPSTDYREEAVPVIDNAQMLNQQINLVETLIQFEVTSKILLAAHLNKFTINPLTYCFNAMNIKLFQLPDDHPEYTMIKTFISRSRQIKKGFLQNIFAIERRGEAERYEPLKKFGNRMLLWHGSKVSNYMGILSQGLKVAPPWAFSTGAMFGKGIYFADMFEKSYAYTHDWQIYLNRYNGVFQQTQQRVNYEDEMKEIQKFKYMLLCEVALGKSQEHYQASDIQKLPNQFQSVKGLGRQGPNYESNIVLSNGCKVPIGQVIEYPIKHYKDPAKQVVLQHNEYIVYNEAQIRIRYLVQLDGNLE